VFDKLSKIPYEDFVKGDFSAKVGGEDFKRTAGNESLHKITIDNGITVVHFETYKNLTVKSTMFPHCNIYKYS
jgi:hypothetical protein